MSRTRTILLISSLLFIGLMDAATRISIEIKPEQTAGQIANKIIQRAATITGEIDLKIRFTGLFPRIGRTALLNAVFQQLVQQDRTLISRITEFNLGLNHLRNRQIQLDLSLFTSLERLDLYENDLMRLPNLTGLVHLKELWLQSNQLWQQSEPLDLSPLPSLEKLDLYGNALMYLPNLTGSVHLKVLGLGNNKLGQLKLLDFALLMSLEKLNLNYNNLTRLPNLTGLVHFKAIWLGGNPGLAGQRLRIPAGVRVSGIDPAHIDYFVPEPTTVGDERILTNIDEFTLITSLLLAAYPWLTDNDIAPIVDRVQAQFEQGNHVGVAELKRWLEEDELVQRYTKPAQVTAVENAASNLELFDVATSDDDRPVFLSRSTLMGLQAGRRYFNPLNRQPILPVGKARNLAAAWLYWHAIREEDGSYRHPVGAQYFEALARQDDPVAHEPFTVATIIALDYLKTRGLNDAQSSAILRELPKQDRSYVQVNDLFDVVAR